MTDCDSKIACDSDRTLVFNKNGYLIWDCKKCNYRFAQIDDKTNHVSKVYSDDYFFNGKDGYPNYLDEKDILYKHGLHYAHLISKYSSPGRILDVGSAAGFILKAFDDQGWECSGIEPNDTMAAYGRNILNLDISTTSLEGYKTDQKFDLISLIQVIGHFYDVDKALTNITGLLLPQGLVLVESWNMNSLIARLFGRYWHEYSPPSVINWFSDKSLIKFFDDYGLELVNSGHPIKQLNLKHALSLLEKDAAATSVKKNLIDSLKNSFGEYVINYPPTDLKWYVFKKK